MALKDIELKNFSKLFSPSALPMTQDSHSSANFASLRAALPASEAAKKQNAVVNFGRRRIILLPFALILGVCFYVSSPTEPNIWLYLVALSVAGGATVFLRQSLVLHHIFFIMTFVLLGIVITAMTGHVRGSKLLSFPTAKTVSGEVRRVEVNSGGDYRLFLALKPEAQEALFGVRNVRLTVKTDHFPPDVFPRIGDQLQARARFIPVPKPSYPGAYDPQFHAYFDGIAAYGTSLDGVVLTRATEKFAPLDVFFNYLFDLRYAIADRLHLAMDDEAASISQALIIGDQSKIDPSLRDEIAFSGLAHLLAISGLHLSLVAGGIFLGVRMIFALPFFSGGVQGKVIAAIIAMAAALFYLGISGANIATQRATIMLIIAFVAVLTGRRAITIRNVALVAIGMIVIYPDEVFKPGFQLSFAAVGALVGVYEWMRQRAQSIHYPRLIKFFGGLALTSLVAGLATAPIAAVHFNQFAPFGLFANLVAVPIVGFMVLPLLILACVLMPFGLDGPILATASHGISWVVEIAQFFAQLGGDLTYVPPQQNWVLGLCAIALMLFLLLRCTSRFLPPIVAGVAIFAAGNAPTPDMLISDQTRSVFIKQTGVDGVSYAQVDRVGNNFTTRVWGEWLGQKLENQMLIGACDKQGCIADTQMGRILLARSEVAILEDCGQVALIIEQFYAYQTCKTTELRLDHRDVNTFGTAAIYITSNKVENDDQPPAIEVRHAIVNQNRPWRVGYGD